MGMLRLAMSPMDWPVGLLSPWPCTLTGYITTSGGPAFPEPPGNPVPRQLGTALLTHVKLVDLAVVIEGNIGTFGPHGIGDHVDNFENARLQHTPLSFHVDLMVRPFVRQPEGMYVCQVEYPVTALHNLRGRPLVCDVTFDQRGP